MRHAYQVTAQGGAEREQGRQRWGDVNQGSPASMRPRDHCACPAILPQRSNPRSKRRNAPKGRAKSRGQAAQGLAGFNHQAPAVIACLC
jgi:hypothetical protein